MGDKTVEYTLTNLNVLKTDDERRVEALEREVARWKEEARLARESEERMDRMLALKNQHIERLEKTVKYLRSGGATKKEGAP